MTTSVPKVIELVPIASLDIESQLEIRNLRNEDTVRKWMYTDHLIGMNEHLAWLSRAKQDRGKIIFAVRDVERKTLGIVSINDIDITHKTTEWAYYLTETARGGLGSALEYALIDFVFGVLKMEKLNCEVIEGNESVVKLHKKFLFQEEGFRRSNIIKEGSRRGIHLLGLTINDWLAGKDNIRTRYGEIFDKFKISIHWSPDSEGVHPIDQIEAARARNNLNWMNILRLALEKSPANAKPIVEEIKRLDREISVLTDRLTDEKH